MNKETIDYIEAQVEQIESGLHALVDNELSMMTVDEKLKLTALFMNTGRIVGHLNYLRDTIS